MNFLADTPRLELFRLAGIPVRVDITFALVPLFLFGILQQAPLAIAAPAFAAIIAGVFLSVLLHEIGHATVAGFWRRRNSGRRLLRLRPHAQKAAQHRRQCRDTFRWPLDQWTAVSWTLELARFSRDQSQRLFRESRSLTMDRRAPLANVCRPDFGARQPCDADLQSAPRLSSRWRPHLRDLIATITSRASAAKIIAGLGVIVGLWSAFVGLRINIVLMLIGAEIAIVNWAILKRPADAEQM